VAATAPMPQAVAREPDGRPPTTKAAAGGRGAASTPAPRGAGRCPSASTAPVAPMAGRLLPAARALRAPPPPPPSSTPRNLAALAALAVQGGATRYDLPQTVTIPDRSATMVMLVARDVPGEQMYLFAPDPGVGDSVSHPFHVARFENRTGGTLERGPIAIFEHNAFLGQGMMESLPDGATTTVPFSLERGVAVESSQTSAVEGSRLVRMVRETLTIERYGVTRTTYRARNGHGPLRAPALPPRPQRRAALRAPDRHRDQQRQRARPDRHRLARAQRGGGHHPQTLHRQRRPLQRPGRRGHHRVPARRPSPRRRRRHAALRPRPATQIAELTQQRDNQVTRRDDLQRNAEETRGNLRRSSATRPRRTSARSSPRGSPAPPRRSTRPSGASSSSTRRSASGACGSSRRSAAWSST
jgi:hypothetical protein